MKKLIVIALVFVAGFAYYRHSRGGANPELRTYEAFVKALRSTRIDDARSLASGEQADRDIAAWQAREADRYRVRGSLTIHRATYTVEDRIDDGDTVTLEVLEELRVDPPGTHSTVGIANVWLRHDVELHKIDGDWKVLAFRCEFDDAEGIDGLDVDNAPRWF